MHPFAFMQRQKVRLHPLRQLGKDEMDVLENAIPSSAILEQQEIEQLDQAEKALADMETRLKASRQLEASSAPPGEVPSIKSVYDTAIRLKALQDVEFASLRSLSERLDRLIDPLEDPPEVPSLASLDAAIVKSKKQAETAFHTIEELIILANDAFARGRTHKIVGRLSAVMKSSTSFHGVNRAERGKKTVYYVVMLSVLRIIAVSALFLLLLLCQWPQ